MAYLDTSTIRSLGSALGGLGSGHCTSVFCTIELLSGILDSEEQYYRRRAAIRTVLGSRISIDWDMPEAKLLHGFEYFRTRCRFEERRVPHLKLILQDVEASRSREELTGRLAKRPTTFGYEFFQAYDSALSGGFIQATVSGHTEIRRGYERSVEKGQIPRGVRLRDFLEGLRQSHLNDALMRYALVEVLSGLPGAEVPDSEKAEVFDSYNGSLDVYVRALSHSSNEMASSASWPGRNDAADLAHLLYVAVGSPFATGDIRLANLARTAGARVVTSVELQRAIEPNNGIQTDAQKDARG
jgi:hypothetical protein